ncbi:MAG: hypothetical protein K2L37_05455 [Lactobacillus sp.]|nr:hypothetical protein [Lactobacillus sp.]
MNASDDDKIVKLPILQYYDENIKKWVANKIYDADNFPVEEIDSVSAEEISSLFGE